MRDSVEWIDQDTLHLSVEVLLGGAAGCKFQPVIGQEGAK